MSYCSGEYCFLFLPRLPSIRYPNITVGSVYRRQVTLDTVPNNLDLTECKFADIAVNFAGRADPP